jgi:hypothetical protein
LTSACFGIEPIKGHLIGETVTEFLAKTSDDTSFLQSCRQATTKALAKKRELSIGARKSETVALRRPVMPVGDGFRG